MPFEFPTRAFTVRTSERLGAPTPDLLALKGKRLGVFSEQSGTRPMNPERIKDLTGGDSITARAPHCTPITFMPTHTLICCGNHIPHVDASDYGFWRRLNIVPFTGRFKPSRLAEQLRSPEHLSAILGWLVRGRLCLNQEGWVFPTVVEQANRACRSESDVLAQWLEECTEPSDSDTWSTTLYQSFQEWCGQRRERCPSHSIFTRRLEQQGYRKRKSNGRPLLCGIHLKQQDISEVQCSIKE